MEEIRFNVQIETIKREYAGIIAAIARTSSHFKVESYLSGTVFDNLNPEPFEGKKEAVKFLFVVETEVEWRSLIRYLIDNEGFHQGNAEDGVFHKRGSPISIQRVKQLDLRKDNTCRIA